MARREPSKVIGHQAKRMPKMDFECSAVQHIRTTSKISDTAFAGLAGNEPKNRRHKWLFQDFAAFDKCFFSIHRIRDCRWHFGLGRAAMAAQHSSKPSAGRGIPQCYADPADSPS